MRERAAPPRERDVQDAIELALGAEPDVLLLRNNVGVARHVADDGTERFVRFGLGPGSPDLLCIVAPLGRVVGLEVKRPGEHATAEQLHVHAVWRRFGAIVESCTRSTKRDEFWTGSAIGALRQLRRGEVTVRTHERTLLQQMGYMDRDRADPLHYLACKYVRLPEVHERLAGLAYADVLARDCEHYLGRVFKGDVSYLSVEDLLRRERVVELHTYAPDTPRFRQTSALVEHAIRRPNGFVVGFVDALLENSWIYPYTRSFRLQEQRARGPHGNECGEWIDVGASSSPDEGRTSETRVDGFVVAVEVKIGETPVDEIVKQLGVYRSCLDARFVVATAFDVTVSDAEVLRAAGAVHVRLGPRFVHFAQKALTEQSAKSPEA